MRSLKVYFKASSERALFTWMRVHDAGEMTLTTLSSIPSVESVPYKLPRQQPSHSTR